MRGEDKWGILEGSILVRGAYWRDEADAYCHYGGDCHCDVVLEGDE